METFTKLFGSLLVFVYHCFDRIVINGYLNGLSRPEQVVHFFRQVLGLPVVSKEVLSQRTTDYRNWVEAFAQRSGPRRESARKTMWRRGGAGWKTKQPTASTSSSKAWNRGPPSAS